MSVENVDYLMALRYITLVGGAGLLQKAGLSRLAPVWKGSRQDLTSVGGIKSKDPKSWRDTKKEIFESEKKRILAVVLEILVNLIMSTHVYTFAGKFYLQRDGGPIGLRSTACIASLVMKLFDVAWLKLLENEGLDIYGYFRYVDDCRNCLQVLAEGWKWNGEHFEFKEEWKDADLLSSISDQSRTTEELAKAMSSLIPFLKFEGEEAGQFLSNKLPTLDTSIWWNGKKLEFEFFEKSTCPNRVLQRDTALSESCIRASLNQEVVRRLLCCSQSLPIDEKQRILSTFAQKLINSGFSLSSSQLILVHGVVRYLELVRRSNLSKDNKSFKPLYVPKEFQKLKRRLKKIEQKSGWYCNQGDDKSSWRRDLPEGWRGSKPSQFKVHGMEYTSVLMVPNSKSGALMKEISKIEPRLSRTTNYHVKIVEKSGKALSNLFSKNMSTGKCHRDDCAPCSNEKVTGASLCKAKNVVYESVCSVCDAENAKDPSKMHEGMYIGQTCRTLYERSLEHHAALNRLDMSSFMLKHWAIKHSDLESPPQFRFRVLQCHKDPMSRLLHEAVRIVTHATMNSRGEFKGYTIPRLSIEPTHGKAKEEIENIDKLDKWEEAEMLKLRAKHRNSNPNNNRSNCSRKRPVAMDKSCSELSPIVKRVRNENEQSRSSEPKNNGFGKWSTSSEKSVRRNRKLAQSVIGTSSI